jgi:hypothetical protein
MKKFVILILFINIFVLSALDQEIKERTFLVKTLISSNKIDFSWEYEQNTIDVIVRKKLDDEQSFEIIDTIYGTQTTYIDDFITGKIYEYSFTKRFLKSRNNDVVDTISSYAYLTIGEKISPNHFQGSLLLLVDSLFLFEYKEKVERLKIDLIGDGWNVNLVEAPRTQFTNRSNVKNIKDIISSYYESDDQLHSVFLLGRIAVPYSGVMAPDGHDDHVGAWPTDSYYGELDGIWTDTVYHAPSIVNERNHNLPSDGKSDNNLIPSDIDLCIGRVDMYDLPMFEMNELELLGYYLDKDHEYRNGKINTNDSAIVNDRFGPDYREAFAAGGLMNFYALFNDRVNTSDYLREVLKENNRSFKWFYGCGPGTYTAAHDIAYSEEFAKYKHNAIFSMIFGSYHGDWDSRDNVLRAAIASRPSILTSVWSGRPTWFFHKMLFGQTIGEAAKLTQNYTFDEYPSMAVWGDRVVHIALMGDPTLRHHIVQPVENITIQKTSNFGLEINWEYEHENSGFYIYRSNNIDGKFELMNDSPIYELSFIDKSPLKGKNLYMVRANKLQEHHNGSYYNLSLGKIAEFDFSIPEIANVYPNPANEKINFFYDIDEDAHMKIYDSNGKIVIEKIINNKKGYILEEFYLNSKNSHSLNLNKILLKYILFYY